MPNSYPRGGTFNPHLLAIKDYFSLDLPRFKSKYEEESDVDEAGLTFFSCDVHILPNVLFLS